MKNLLPLLLLLFVCGSALSQNSYNISSIPFNPDPYAAGTLSGITADDMYGAVLQLPFSFCFYDQSYTKMVIGSNGIVTFDTSQANAYCPWPLSGPIPNAATTDLSIMAPQQDIDPGMGGSINYDVHGVAPYRRFVISYFEIPMFSCNSMLFSEQVILYETTNMIETHLMNKPLCTTWNSGAAVHGIQVDSATAFVVTGRNYPTQWTATNDGYRFTPVGACAGIAPSDSVNGKVYTDYNHNCVMDANEFPIHNRAILANAGQYYGWTNALGHYAMGLAAGGYAINEYLMSPFFASSCTAAGTYNIVLSGTIANNIDFADSASTICSDLNVDIGTSSMRRCGYSVAGITYCNNGTYPDSNVVVTIVLNDSISIDSANAPYTSLGANTYSFSVGNLMPGQCGNIQVNLGIGCDTLGTIYCVSASIAGTYPTDCNLLNNQSSDCHALVAAFDPNEKLVAAQNGMGYVRNDDIDGNDELTYQINFQNLGTSYAEDIEIRDTLDALLRPETFQAGAGIAPYNYVVIGNVVIFRFENIMLPAAIQNEVASHGFVKFSIGQQAGNMPGTIIHNQASIYFDQAPAVVTNQTINTIPLTSAVLVSSHSVANLYPNPGKDQVIVWRTFEVELTFKMFDITGKQLRSIQLSELRTTVSTADLSPGVYLYRLESHGELQEVGKWIKQ